MYAFFEHPNRSPDQTAAVAALLDHIARATPEERQSPFVAGVMVHLMRLALADAGSLCRSRRRHADMTKIITAAERMVAMLGLHLLVIGLYGVGKTWLLRTLDPLTTLFVNVENGDLGVHDVPVPHVRPQTWEEIRDLIVRIAGPDPSFGPNEPYSQAHFDRAGGWLPGIENVRTVFFDTVTAAGRLCFRWSQRQPEATSDRGKADLRGAYGLHAREFLLAMHHLQSARALNVVLVGAMETTTDEYGRVVHALQIEGQRIPREIVGIVDEVITMALVDFADGKPIRAFVCSSPNQWAYPASSGRLGQVEPPDLGKLITKILPSQGEPSSSPKAPPVHESENTRSEATSSIRTDAHV